MKATDDKPLNRFIHTTMPKCKREPLAQRLLYCAFLLKLQGMLTDAEASAVYKRISKAMEG